MKVMVTLMMVIIINPLHSFLSLVYSSLLTHPVFSNRLLDFERRRTQRLPLLVPATAPLVLALA